MKKLSILFTLTILLGINQLIAQNENDEMMKRFDKMVSVLELNQEQQAQVQELIADRNEQMMVLKEMAIKEKELEESKQRMERLKRIQKRREMNDQFRLKLSEILTAEQMEEFDRMVRNRKAKMKEERHKHNDKSHSHSHDGEEDHSH